MRILVVEDDAVLREGLEVGLGLYGFSADGVGSAEDARLAFEAAPYEIVVLDIALPDGSGLDLLKEWRSAGSTRPVLLLTARNSVADRIDGLDLGADDYLGKPFDLEEVAARLRALSRRAAGQPAATVSWREIVLDLNRHTLELAGEAVPISRREFAILRALIERPGFVFSRSQLEDRIYGWQEEVGSNAIEVHIHNLRAKLGRDVIETVRGVGYRLGSE